VDKHLRLKCAIQKSGRLTDHSLDLLTRCGLKYSRGRDQLLCFGENMPLDVLLVRDDDIPELVQDDVCDFGIVGQNVIEEKRLLMMSLGRAPLFEQVMALDYGRCRLALAVPENSSYQNLGDLEGRRIATTYPHLLGRFLGGQGLQAEVVVLSGAVEIAPRLGRADFVCDLVSTGATLAANGLREVHTVFESRAALIQTPAALPADKASLLTRLLARIDGVQQVKESKYIMLHAPRAMLGAITRLLPGAESPTVLPLDGRDDRVAIHAVCRETVFWETLESLKAVGATSILVLPVEKMLA